MYAELSVMIITILNFVTLPKYGTGRCEKSDAHSNSFPRISLIYAEMSVLIIIILISVVKNSLNFA